jgi:hypothetical protein
MSHEHVSNIGRIWKVFGILSAVTIVEVYLGILKPDFLFMNDFLSMNLNWIFYALTILKRITSFMRLCIWKVKKLFKKCSCLSSNFSDFIFALHSFDRRDYIYEVLKFYN